MSVISPDPRETQPLWYESEFTKLLANLGLAEAEGVAP